MALDVFFKDDIANVLSSNMSMAVATVRASVQVSGQVDRSYLLGVLSAQRALAKGFGLSWSAIVVDALSDIGEPYGDGLVRAADRSLENLIGEVERLLLLGEY